MDMAKLLFKPLDIITDEQIAETIAKSREEAKKSIKDLGMYDLLHSNDCWENPPTPLIQVDQNAI